MLSEGEHEGVCWGRGGGGGGAVGLRGGVGEVACPEKEVCTTYNIQADI